MAPADRRHRHLNMFPGDRTAAGIAFTRRTLADWHLTDPAACTDALLVAAELLANAAQHTPGPERLDIDLGPAGLTLAVTDPSTDIPRPGALRPDTPHGHGLVIVDRLALAWGHRPTPTGKTVWALLPARATDSSGRREHPRGVRRGGPERRRDGRAGARRG
ncbi:ATP-binding protein [Streptomyces sp. TLI_171]|uniref:ATP-binding protein n=1 Tax=Streptomyces sp. TLI_171 TaxID=1938859 RepID=UPI000C1786A5|nr:ATP-binding protein [Streptomyces sp. TLI_171]RKE23565.1 hypothetical protein BX266_7040 [Streptomyces sp. TLI_171]